MTAGKQKREEIANRYDGIRVAAWNALCKALAAKRAPKFSERHRTAWPRAETRNAPLQCVAVCSVFA